MRKVNFKGLDPEDLHTCQHCQYSFHDIGMNLKMCARSGQPISPINYIQVNDRTLGNVPENVSTLLDRAEKEKAERDFEYWSELLKKEVNPKPY